MIYCFGNEGGGSQRRPAEGRGGAGGAGGARPGRQKNNKHVVPRRTALPVCPAAGPPHGAARTPSEMRAMANHIISQLVFFSSHVRVPFFVPTVTHCYHFFLVFSFPIRRRRPPFLFLSFLFLKTSLHDVVVAAALRITLFAGPPTFRTSDERGGAAGGRPLRQRGSPHRGQQLRPWTRPRESPGF